MEHRKYQIPVDQKHEGVILMAEYENGEAAEDAMAEFAAFGRIYYSRPTTSARYNLPID